jgi:hypothetical protein
MKFVYTRKEKLVPTEYKAFDIFEASKSGLTRELHEMYPAPESFIIPNGTKQYPLVISASSLQLLAIWYCRGTAIYFCETYLRPACKLQVKHPQAQWHYDMVDSMPQAYIKSGHTSTQSALDYGRNLIERCNKASLIPFSHLEEAYKIIARACLDTGRYIRVYSPNEKTLMEAQAELETVHVMNSIFDTTACTSECPLPDEALAFYARVFDIQMPEWFLRASNVRLDLTSAKGKNYFTVAVLPFVDSSDYVPGVQFDQSGDIKTYDGFMPDAQFDNAGKLKPINTTVKVIPGTYARDAQPQRLQNPEAQRKQLAEQVMFYLSLPIEEQKEYMTNNYAYCDSCHDYYEIREGCKCGAHEKFVDDNAYYAFMLTRKFATEYVDVREVRMNGRL